MYVRMLRYCKGTVNFQMYGKGIEDCLNETLSDGIKLWNLKQKNQKLYGCITAREYRAFWRIAHKNQTRIHMIRKAGVPFYLHRFFNRKGLVLGTALGIICLLLSQNFIWAIDIHDYEGKDREYLSEVMENHGIKIGAYIPTLDFRKLQQEILMEVEDISWMALNRKGTVVEAEVSEKVVPPDIRESHPCNVIAKRDGQVVSMDVYNGREMVELKQAVSKGDLLVSGILDDEMGNVRQVHADAKVIAQTVRTHTIRFHLNQSERCFIDGGTSRRAIEILGVRIPLYIDFSLPHPSDIKEEKEELDILGYRYPVTFITENHHYYENLNTEYSREEGREIIANAFHIYEEEELKSIRILSFKDQEIEKDGVLSITREYLCEEDIAVKMQLSINE